jgi:protoporphyrinogen/coproporphyrinogen III oxidase
MAARRHGPVVVIGGGISGLACAERLGRGGADVVCLEASGRPGGALRSHTREGFVVEAGASTVLETPELSQLIATIGLADEVVHTAPNLPRYILRGSELHALPTGPVSLIRSRVVSPGAKWRILREPWMSPRRTQDDESVAEFVRRRFGGEIAEAIAAPFVAGTFAGDPSKLSARAALPSLVDLETRHGSVIRGMFRAARQPGSRRARLISFRDGLETLPRRLSERLGERLRMHTTVRIMRRGPAGCWIVSAVAEANSVEITASAIVLATPARTASRLLEQACAPAAATLAEVESASVTSMSLAWPRSQISDPLHGIGFLVAPGERVRILGCLWPASMFAGRAPDDFVPLTTFVGGALDPQAVTLEDEALIEVVRADLASVLHVRGAPRALAIDRHFDALPQYAIGHSGRMARAREAIDAVPGLFACGNYFCGVSVGECVRAAQHAAEAVMGFLA